MITTSSERGSFMVFAALTITTLIAVVGLMVDSVWVYTCKMQMRNAVDALAVIGAKTMVTDDTATAMSAVLSQAGDFRVGEKQAILESQDVRFGKYDATTGVFTENSTDPETVEVTLRRILNSPTGPIPLFFSTIFGNRYKNLTMKAYSSISSLDLILITDISGSMAGQPIIDAKNGAISFLQYLRTGSDRVGFVSYSQTATLRSSLTYTFSSVQIAINSVTSGGSTNIADGILKARNELNTYARPITARVIVLLSDGQPNTNLNGSSATTTTAQNLAKAQANLAKQEGIMIFSISLSSGADRALMQYIATTTGGKEYYAPTGAQLQTIYKEVAKDLPVKLAG